MNVGIKPEKILEHERIRTLDPKILQVKGPLHLRLMDGSKISETLSLNLKEFNKHFCEFLNLRLSHFMLCNERIGREPLWAMGSQIQGCIHRIGGTRE